MDLFESEGQTYFGDRLKRGERLSRHLNFRLGGPASYFLEVKTEEELVQAITLADAQGVPWFVLGGGSNTLASDEGFEGLVIKLALRGYAIQGTQVHAQAGMITAALARATAKAGLAGFTWAISLPGTIGGAVRGNAGCFGGEMKDTVREARVLRSGQIRTLSHRDLAFGYRESAIKHSKDVVLSATLELVPADPKELQEQLEKTLGARKSTQPLYAGSAGCLFKNYEVPDMSTLQRLGQILDIPTAMIEAHRIGAGWLIEQMGLKGTCVGGARISPEHGNFVLNTDGATAADVKALIDLVKQTAAERFSIQLEEEVQLIGF